ncbi:MAG: glycine zipper domain-containing protein [Vulcanimicrobiaceae bacterium]
MRYLLNAAAMAIAFFMVGQVASAAPVAGTRLSGTIAQSVDTKTAYVGQRVELTNVRSTDGSISGARMYGTVTSVQRAGQGRPAKLQVTFSRLVLANGSSYAVNGVVTGMQATTKNNALKEAAGAVGGMLIGNMIGKTVFHSSMGGLLGAAGGFMIAKNNRENMSVTQGSTVNVELRSARRQASH